MPDDAPVAAPFERQIPKRYAVVINPRSGNGRAWKQWTRLEPELAQHVPDYEVFPTERPEHATELTRLALENGFDRIISAGGDGTHYEVLNGFFENDVPVNPDASLGILPIGTACDLRKTHRIPKGPAAIPFLTSDRVVPIDVARLTSTIEDGSTITRYFNTAAHIGLGGLVGEHTNRRSKALGGFMTFLLGLISARIAYSEKEMTVDVDGESFEGKYLEVIVAKGFYDGGGMQVGPHGFLDNGLLEIYLVGELGLVGSALNIPRLYRGTHDKHPAVQYLQGKRIRVTSKERVVVSPDGEVAGVLPASVEVVPKAVRIVTGPEPRLLRPEV